MRAHLLLLLAGMFLFGESALGSIPVTASEISTDAARVESDHWQMFFDAEKKTIYVFAPASQSVNFTVTPLPGWSWNKSRTTPDESTKRCSIRGQSSGKSFTLYSRSKEDRFDFDVVVREIIAYVEIDPYLGVNMKNSTNVDFFRRSNMRSARMHVVPDSGFAIADRNPCSWTISNVSIEEKTKNSVEVSFCLPKSGSRSENCEKASVKVSGTFKGNKRTLEGFANFTIVCVDVCIAGVTEAKEDAPGYQCEKGSAITRSPVKFTCTPGKMSSRANALVVNGARLCEKYVDNSGTKYREAGDFTVDRLNNNNACYLDTSVCAGGSIEILHPASGAVDAAKYACWGLEFKTPSGDPVREPKLGKNEFCYNTDDQGKCVINLVVGVVPDGVKGVSLDSIKQQYKGARFSVDNITDPGVKVEWDEDFGGNAGKWSIAAGNIECRARVTYVGMPEKNASFGLKHAMFQGGKRPLSAVFEVFFPKSGRNHPACQKCPECPNWFYYWQQGAVPGLGRDDVKFREVPEHHGYCECAPAGCTILVTSSAAEFGDEFVVKKYCKNGLAADDRGLFYGDNGNMVPNSEVIIGIDPEYRGVAFAASVVCHEQMHADIYNAKGEKMDMDSDGVADDCEQQFGFDTYQDMPESYNFAVVSGLASGSDNEIRARLAERDVMTTKPYNVKLDWAMPGCQSENIWGPPECYQR